MSVSANAISVIDVGGVGELVFDYSDCATIGSIHQSITYLFTYLINCVDSSYSN